jgi:acetolactate synthase-1/2/3 large subunit
MKLSDYVIKYLKDKYGVEVIFTVSGGGCIHLIDSLANVPGVKYMAMHHEQAAAIAAEGYAKMHNKLGACLVTSGPGGTNAITGVLCAWTDSMPIIVISGQVNKNLTTCYTKLPLRQFGDQELNIIDVVKTITKYAVQVNDPNEIKYHLDKACLLATSGRPGPVWIDIPLDVQSAIIDPEALMSYKEESSTPCVSSERLSAVVNKLNNAKKPLLIVGNGIRISDAVEELHKFIKRTNIPVISAPNGNDLVNESYNGYVGRFGTHAQICANILLGECDFLLSIGSRLYVRQIGYDFEGFAKNAYKVYVDIDYSELTKPTLFPDMAIHSDAKLFLSGLLNEILPCTNSEWLQYCVDKYKNTPKVLERHRDIKNYVSHYYFIERLNEHLLATDHVITSDGFANAATMQVIKLKGNQRLISNIGAAPMGYGLSSAIGAASTGTPVVCMEGDGSLHLNVHQLQTMKYYALPIKVILLNNQGYSSIKITQKTFFNSRFVASEKSSGVSFPNFEKLMIAYDLPYMSVKTNNEIDEALKIFLRGDGPSVLEVFSDPNEVMEPKVPAKIIDGKLFPGTLQDIKWMEL